MRQVGKILVVAFLLATLAPNAAHAAFFSKVEVLKAGVTNGGPVFIRLRHAVNTPQFTEAWFEAPFFIRKEILATALTAISLDLKVQVNLNLTNKDVLVMYLVK